MNANRYQGYRNGPACWIRWMSSGGRARGKAKESESEPRMARIQGCTRNTPINYPKRQFTLPKVQRCSPETVMAHHHGAR